MHAAQEPWHERHSEGGFPSRTGDLQYLERDTDQDGSEALTLQTVGETEWVPVDTYMDSGAARSVCPLNFCAEFGTRETESSKRGEHFRTAAGTKIQNEGERVIRGLSNDGDLLSMRYAVADVTVPLDSISQMCDNGATVVFNKHGGYILRRGGRVDFERRNDSYVRRSWVRRKKPTEENRGKGHKTDQDVDMTAGMLHKPSGFTRQGPKCP